MARRAVILVALLLWGLLAFMTLFVLFDSGPDPLVIIGLLVVAVLGVGVFGAMSG